MSLNLVFQIVYRYVNVILNGVKPGYVKGGFKGSLFLENPVGENIITFDQLKTEVNILISRG